MSGESSPTPGQIGSACFERARRERFDISSTPASPFARAGAGFARALAPF
jgi:hypothetical protein